MINRYRHTGASFHSPPLLYYLLSKRRANGFTLVELMIVVAVIGVLAALAVISIQRTRIQGDIDLLANDIRAAVIQARSRAVATRTPYLLDIRAKSIQWCQIANLTANPVQATCPTPGTPFESGPLITARPAAQISFFDQRADVTIAGIASPAGNRQPIGAGAPLYFGANGTADSNFNNVASAGTLLYGFTVYIQPTSPDDPSKHRRVIVWGVSSRPRIIDNW